MCTPDTAPILAQAPPVSAVSVDFAAIYREHFDFVWRTARRMLIPTKALDDVVQDVFLVIHRRLGEYDGRAPLRGWIYGITQRVVAAYRRRERRKEAPLTGTEIDDDGEERFISLAPPPNELVEQAESMALLERLLARLGPKKAEVFVLAHLEQLTVPEIAEGVGENLNTVYSRLRAARKELDELVVAHREGRLA